MEKKRSLQEFFKRSRQVYGQYLDAEKVNAAERSVFEKNVGHQYDRNFCRDKIDEINKRTEMRKNDAGKVMRGLESEFSDLAYSEADLSGKLLEGKLVTALNSGINYTSAELLALAKENVGLEANSRLIRDYATKSGYTIKGSYVSPEEKISLFENFNKALITAMSDDSGFIRLDPTAADSLTENYIKKLFAYAESMEIEKTPDKIEEWIASDIRQQRKEETPADNEKFLEGFGAAVRETHPEFYVVESEEEQEERR